MTTALDETRLHVLVGKMVGELGAVVNGALVITGDRLGLYKALATNGPQTPADLAERTGTTERYIREWLSAQAASGFVEYDPDTQRFYMTREQELVFADENSPVLMTGGFYSAAAVIRDEPRLTEAFRTGEGVA